MRHAIGRLLWWFMRPVWEAEMARRSAVAGVVVRDGLAEVNARLAALSRTLAS
jgi:hypothetical protein